MKVSILEDELVLAESLAAALSHAGMTVVGTHTDPSAFLSELSWKAPDVAIVDLKLEHPTHVGVVRDGTDVLDVIRRTTPHVRTLVLSADRDPDRIEQCRELGASAYLLKHSARPAVIVDAIHRVGAGERLFPVAILRSKPSAPRAPGALDVLTPRELEALRFIVAGRENPEIAAQLNITPRTVKAHLAAMYRKLGCKNRTQLALKARELGVIHAP